MSLPGTLRETDQARQGEGLTMRVFEGGNTGLGKTLRQRAIIAAPSRRAAMAIAKRAGISATRFGREWATVEDADLRQLALRWPKTLLVEDETAAEGYRPVREDELGCDSTLRITFATAQAALAYRARKGGRVFVAERRSNAIWFCAAICPTEAEVRARLGTSDGPGMVL